ncbi:MAG TPA: NADP-dependent oxidoreductase [Agriterribacter sp.]|nr:NADP-dependent oxidoreductase [Agriterribacter sp.]
MKGWVLEAPGDRSNLVLKDLPVPAIRNEEVLVAVKALSINPIDIKTRSGKGLYSVLKNDSPLVLGWDISGVVVDAGNNVNGLKPGDAVFGMVNFPGHGKCYAEYVAAPAHHLAIKPAQLSHQEAAAASLAALTAWQAIHSYMPLQKKQRVLIHAAAGGVGHFAVQIAKSLGAWVAGTASSTNRDFVLGIGADKHIDYTTAPLKEQVSDIDFVFDAIGGKTIDDSLDVMNKGGTIVSIPSGLNENVAEKALEKGMQGYRFLVKSSGSDMNALANLLAKGIIRSHISHRFQFEDIAAAHAQIETGRTRGKVIVDVAQ